MVRGSTSAEAAEAGGDIGAFIWVAPSAVNLLALIDLAAGVIVSSDVQLVEVIVMPSGQLASDLSHRPCGS